MLSEAETLHQAQHGQPGQAATASIAGDGGDIGLRGLFDVANGCGNSFGVAIGCGDSTRPEQVPIDDGQEDGRIVQDLIAARSG